VRKQTAWDSALAPVSVATGDDFATLLRALSAQTAVAVDTESNSLYAYRERVCLIQFSVPEADYIVDPLVGLDLSPLADVFADPRIQKVFHAAEYDVICLKRDFGFRMANLFDTMWAARILGWPRVGLGDVLETAFGVHTNKRFQKYNWGKRPLDAEALMYACLDTHYLLPLRDLQIEALKHRGRLEEAQEVFEQLAALEASPTTFDPQDFWRVKGAFDLTAREQAVLRELYIWRDWEARRRDRPPFKVLNDRMLVELARARPRRPEELLGIGGLKPYHVRRYGRRILRAIRRGEQAHLPQPPSPPPRHSKAEVDRFEALRAWRRQVAAKRGVDPDVVLSNAALWALAEQNPRSFEALRQIEELGLWKRRVYGEAVLKVLDRVGR